MIHSHRSLTLSSEGDFCLISFVSTFKGGEVNPLGGPLLQRRAKSDSNANSDPALDTSASGEVQLCSSTPYKVQPSVEGVVERLQRCGFLDFCTVRAEPL